MTATLRFLSGFRLPRAPSIFGVVAALAFAWVALFAPRAWAQSSADYPLPKLEGYVVDSSGKLTPAEVRALDDKLDAIRKRTGFSIVAYVTPSLRGLPIDDVAYKAFNEWGVGTKGADTGVLLVISTGERKIRIETGKGVGGALTDVQSVHIIREVIAPRMNQGRVRDAVDAGTDAIADALMKGSTPEERKAAAAGKKPPPRAGSGSRMTPLLAVGGLLLVIFLAIVSPTFRQMLFFFLLFGRGGGGGGFGGGGGGSRGSGGGGGSSGGGGASDDY